MPSFQSPSPPQFRRQRGAISVFAVLTLLLAVLFAALALDTGRLFLEQRRLQNTADLSALSAARFACGGVPDLAAATAQANAAAAANGHAGDLGVDFAPAGDDSAARVTASGEYPTSLLAGGVIPGTTRLRATAAAVQRSVAGISAGSFLARLDPAGLNPLLSGLLGSNVNLGLADYQGIAAANLTLLDLIQAHGAVATVNDLLALQMNVGAFFDLMATALDNKGKADAAGDLRNLAAGASDALVLTLGDLLKVTADDPETSAEAEVNALDLLMLTAEIANGQNAIAIPAAGVAIPGVANIGVNLWLIQPPQIAIGPAGRDENGNWKTQVQTAQVRLGVNLALTPVPLGIPGILTIQLANLQLAVDAAQTTAWLESIGCPSPGNPDGSATMGSQPGILNMAIGNLDANGQVTGPANVAAVQLLGGLGGPAVTVGASANASLESNPQSTPFEGPFPQTETVDTPPDEALTNALADLANSLDLQVTVGTLNLMLLNQVIGLLRPVLTPIITLLGDALLTPLLDALGVSVGGADLSVFTIRVDRPALVL